MVSKKLLLSLSLLFLAGNLQTGEEGEVDSNATKKDSNLNKSFLNSNTLYNATLITSGIVGTYYLYKNSSLKNPKIISFITLATVGAAASLSSLSDKKNNNETSKRTWALGCATLGAAGVTAYTLYKGHLPFYK